MEEKNNNKAKSDIFSKAVRAGKRTYFFDVKATKDENLYVTITESKRRFKNDGGFFYEKHKLFLYKEDFIKFAEGLNEAVEYIRQNNPTPVEEQTYNPNNHNNNNNSSNERSGDVGNGYSEPTKENKEEEKVPESNSFSDVDFDDLK